MEVMAQEMLQQVQNLEAVVVLLPQVLLVIPHQIVDTVVMEQHLLFQVLQYRMLVVVAAGLTQVQD
jgi:hypothetical protein